MIGSLVTLIIVGFVLGLLWFAIDWIGGKFGMPEKFRNVLKGVVALIGVLILVNFLLQLAGQDGFIRWR